MSNRKVKLSDIIDFVTASDSELSELSDDDNDNEIEVPQNVLVSTVGQYYQKKHVLMDDQVCRHEQAYLYVSRHFQEQ